jgi:23S rRNA pseudouridine2605 synthase
MSDKTDDTGGAQRVAKLIARAGVCSRREAERLIEQRRVAVDDQTLTTPAVTVDDPQRITIDGERLPQPEPTRIFRFHKPSGVVTTERDPEGRKTIYDVLPEGLPRLMPVGRLDLTSEGLLLLTNDGALKRKLELPDTGWIRRYRVRVFGEPDPDQLATLQQGITIDGVRYGSIDAQVDTKSGANTWVTISLKEGRNREVRRVMEHLGYRVNRLLRVAYGPFQLGSMKRGEVKEVPPKVLAEQLGLDQPAQKVGTAKAKVPKNARKPDKPRKPGAKPPPGTKSQATKSQGRKPTRDTAAKPGTQDKQGKPHAHRRRTS